MLLADACDVRKTFPPKPPPPPGQQQQPLPAPGQPGQTAAVPGQIPPPFAPKPPAPKTPLTEPTLVVRQAFLDAMKAGIPLEEIQDIVAGMKPAKKKSKVPIRRKV